MKSLFRLLALVAVALMLRPPIEEEVQTPEEWDDLRDSLGDALHPDGSVDFDRLSEKARTVDFDEWRQEKIDERSTVAVSDHT